MSEQRRRGRRQRIPQTPHKEVSFSQQHKHLKERKSSFSSACFKNVVFSFCEVVKAGPSSNLNRPCGSHQASSLFLFFFFYSLHTLMWKKENLNQTEVPPRSHDLPDNAHTDIRTLLFSDSCSVCLAGERVNTNTHRLTPFRKDGKDRWGNSPS